jgi:transcriptional antiterminator RfaH
MKRWFVVHTHTQSEAKAALHLARQEFKVYLPQFLKTRRHARRQDIVKKPLFPNYLFVAIDLSLDRWRSINSTIGVRQIICNGETPVPVPEQLIDDIRQREDDRGNVRLNKFIKFCKGDLVQIIDGVLSSQEAIFDSVRDEDRVQVLLNLLGGPIKVTLPLDSINANT